MHLQRPLQLDVNNSASISRDEAANLCVALQMLNVTERASAVRRSRSD